VIENGKIVQQGKHERLIEEEGLYKKYISIREASAGWQLK
jgi:ATP-binding cassette subfamily B protein